MLYLLWWSQYNCNKKEQLMIEEREADEEEEEEEFDGESKVGDVGEVEIDDKPSKFSRPECHILGWTDNPSTMRWNVTVVNCHSRQFVKWTLHLGQNAVWSVYGWTDHQGTINDYCLAPWEGRVCGPCE
jgi:hypothetical protein